MTTETLAERRVAHCARQLDAQLVDMARRVNTPVKGVSPEWLLAAGAVVVGLLLVPTTWRKRLVFLASHAAMQRLGLPIL